MEQDEPFTRERLERILCRWYPEAHDAAQALPEDRRAELYDRLGRAMRTAVERAEEYARRG